jgi:hypothetical protein
MCPPTSRAAYNTDSNVPPASCAHPDTTDVRVDLLTHGHELELRLPREYSCSKVDTEDD